jgi:hypothetical protein
VLPPHRQQSMPLCSNSTTLTALKSLHARSAIHKSYFCCSTLFRSLRDYHLPPRWGARDNYIGIAMAPKQATLGYVKSSQTTLGCGDTSKWHRVCYSNADEPIAESSLETRTQIHRNSSRSCLFRPNRRPKRKMQKSKMSRSHLPEMSKPSLHPQQRR